mmetsp:Transcript_119236/g.186104  ORF Transcript_119236/g.186104 Transcript_119236/m.186104 type:complete len:88 (+) Transcript_119236:51-314(+)
MTLLRGPKCIEMRTKGANHKPSHLHNQMSPTKQHKTSITGLLLDCAAASDLVKNGKIASPLSKRQNLEGGTQVPLHIHRRELAATPG